MNLPRDSIPIAKDLEDPFHQGRLSGTWLSLDPEKTVIIREPFLIILVFEYPRT